MDFDRTIRKKLEDWRKYHTESQKYVIAREVKPGEPLHMLTEQEMMTYDMWRSKADLALNEVHTLQVTAYPSQVAYSLDELESEKKLLVKKLKFAENWLEKHGVMG